MIVISIQRVDEGELHTALAVKDPQVVRRVLMLLADELEMWSEPNRPDWLRLVEQEEDGDERE